MGVRMLATVWLVFSASAGRAQNAPPANPGCFRQLFPEPSGLNGYEDLVLASDLARAAESRLNLEAEGVTLSQMRAAMTEPDRRRALALLRKALTRPFTSPRAAVGYATTYPERVGMRSLARLLGRHLHVQFADGNHAEAITDLSAGWELGAALQCENLRGSLGATAGAAIIVREFLAHLEELSAKDCDRVTALVARWMKQPDNALAAIEVERRMMVASLMAARTDPARAREVEGRLAGDGAGEIAPERQRALSALRGGQAERARLLAEVMQRLNTQLDRCAAEARRPYWQQQPVLMEADDSPAQTLFDVLSPVIGDMGLRFATVRQALQILGVHAAILRYRWEHDAAPASLEILQLGDLATDPLNGKPFTYRALDRRKYELTPAAPPAPSAAPEG